MSKSRGQRHRPVERARRPRRRRAALELRLRELAVDAEAGVAREHRRDDQPVPAHALEHLLVLRHLREPRRVERRAPTASAGGADHVLDRWIRSRLHGTVSRGRRRARGASTRCAARRRSSGSSTTSPTGTCAARARGSGTSDDADAHAVLHECLLHDHAAARAVLPVHLRRDVPGPRGRPPSRCTSPTGPTVDEPAIDTDARGRHGAGAPGRVARARGAHRGRGSRCASRSPARSCCCPAAQRSPDVGAGRDRRRAEREAARDRHEPRRTARLLGRPELPPARPEGRQAHAAGEGSCSPTSTARPCGTRSTTDGGFDLDVDGTTIRLEPDDVEVRATSHEELALAQDGGVAVALDTRLDDELRLEGLAREVIRVLNDHRKAKGLEISDRIVAWLRADGDVAEAVAAPPGLDRRRGAGPGAAPGAERPRRKRPIDVRARSPSASRRPSGVRIETGLSRSASSGGGGTGPSVRRRRPRRRRSSPGARRAGRAATGR